MDITRGERECVSLTLIDGEEQRIFTEHPIETAKRALLDAAELEGDGEWAALFRRMASSLPRRMASSLPVGALAPTRSDWPHRNPEQEERMAKRNRLDAEARRAWIRMPMPARAALVLQVVSGGERLIVPELMLRLNAELGYPAGEGSEKAPVAVFNEDVRRLVARMHRAGQVERVAEPAPGCKIRHRYFRKHALDGSEAVA